MSTHPCHLLDGADDGRVGKRSFPDWRRRQDIRAGDRRITVDPRYGLRGQVEVRMPESLARSDPLARIENQHFL